MSDKKYKALANVGKIKKDEIISQSAFNDLPDWVKVSFVVYEPPADLALQMKQFLDAAKGTDKAPEPVKEVAQPNKNQGFRK